MSRGIKLGTERVGKSTVRYHQESDWAPGFCWVFLITNPEDPKKWEEQYIGFINRVENPRRYNAYKLKSDAVLHLLARRARLLKEKL